MNGTLEDTTPAGVLQVLSSQRSTGAVRFLGDSGCTVYLHRGELYFAESAETAEDLAVALVRPGRLTAAQWDASTEAGYPTETVGEELIGTGAISREMLASVVLSVIYDPLIQLFRAPEGDYEFAPDVVHWIGPYRTFGVDAIVSEVRRRTREADEMAPVVPSLDAEVRSARTLPEHHGSVNLKRDDWEVVVAAASGCTVNELAVELGRGRWSTARIVYRLAKADLLMVTAAEVSDPAAGAGMFDTDPLAATSFTQDPGGSDTFDPDSFDAASFGATATEDVATTDAEADGGWDAPVSPSPEFGFDTVDAPPPLDDSVFAGETGGGDAAGTAVDDPDPWSLTAEPEAPAAEDPWSLTAEPEAPAAEDSWGLDEPGAPASDWASTALHDDAPAVDDDDTWSAGLSAVPDPTTDPTAPSADFGADTEPPALHPDIAKALAESTYADSATAINAMAARLGAMDSDDDDDWDSPPAAGDDPGDEFWADGGSEADDFIWKPAVWETGGEAAPLPQREAAARTATAPAGQSGSDPAWLDNLYAEFMPGDTTGGDAPAPAAPAEPATEADAAPKQRTLRRLMSAIRRL